ncbi:MAG TPA: heme o synthase [Caulobacteraceae bacterium]|nr:heme o synthase [Caulobacteraceae bacterium]
MTDTTAAAVSGSPPARWTDYVVLLKPRVMSLVVFTALTGLVCARASMSPALGAVAVLCIAVGAGAAGALNMWYDRDIDGLMRRTRARPIPTGKVQSADALGLGVVLSLLSVMMMGIAANWLAAGLLAFTILFYAIIYTAWLKRSTPQNIVIGGASGALPPVIGWAAAAGHAPINAWLLFMIIFLWTPPHSWALALYTTGDYAKAGVPMMPVAKGGASTRRQIMLYSLVFVPFAVAPAFTGLGGALYLAVSGVGGAVFLLLAFRLWRSGSGEADGATSGLYEVKVGSKDARNLFAFSILYLTLLFAALLAEHVFGLAPLAAGPRAFW